MGVHPLLGIFDRIPAPLLIWPFLVKRDKDHREFPQMNTERAVLTLVELRRFL